MIIIDLILLVVIGVLLYFVFHYKNQRDALQKQVPSSKGLEAARSGARISPKNGKGEPVDWFFVFKLPNAAKNCSNSQGDCSDVCACAGCTKPDNCGTWAENRATGECYFYADSNDSTLRYYSDLGFGCLSDANSPLTQTMAQLTTGKWAIWNDQQTAAIRCSAPHAHSKGAVCYNDHGGFILNTSSPSWPDSDLEPIGCQPISNTEYAQHMFCFSASSASIDSWLKVAEDASLCITESSFLDKKPLEGGSTPAPLTINTQGGMPITVLMKGSKDDYLPWSLVSESLGTGLQVASWTSTSSGTSGWGDAPKYNNGSQSLAQILDINTPHGCFKSLYSYSHSKWAISDSGHWVIAGSMNQQNSQAKRGGDFYAFQNTDLWKSLKSFITKTMPR